MIPALMKTLNGYNQLRRPFIIWDSWSAPQRSESAKQSFSLFDKSLLIAELIWPRNTHKAAAHRPCDLHVVTFDKTSGPWSTD